MQEYISPTQAYQSLVDTGKLESNNDQLRILGALSELSEALQFYRPPHNLKRLWHSLSKTPIAPHGIYMVGGVGRGKTLLMDLFFESAPVERKRRMHFQHFITEIHDRIHTWRQTHQDDDNHDPLLPIAREIRDESWLLCLDEFEVHDVADAMMLGRLFSMLYKRGVITVMTSNLPPEQHYPHGLQRDRYLRFVALMKQRIDVLSLDHGTDYRLKKIKHLDDVYMHPDNKKHRTAMDALFTDLTDGHTPEGLTLEVHGRTLHFAKALDGVVYSDFDMLCGQPLGKADYHKLAQTCHTLCMEGIPKLTPDKRNEARRFVMLVDALYDHRINFICTAAAAPEKLYPKGDGHKEFTRTVSRLNEMQSGHYLAEAPRRFETES